MHNLQPLSWPEQCSQLGHGLDGLWMVQYQPAEKLGPVIQPSSCKSDPAEACLNLLLPQNPFAVSWIGRLIACDSSAHNKTLLTMKQFGVDPSMCMQKLQEASAASKALPSQSLKSAWTAWPHFGTLDLHYCSQLSEACYKRMTASTKQVSASGR